MSNNNNQTPASSSWNPGMISIEAELLSVERDFFSGKCGAFETADAQQAVTQQLSSLKNLENQLFAQSRALWDWSAEEQGLWQNAMHRQQQQPQNGGGGGATPSPGMMGNNNQQQQMNGADQLASLFAKRDQSLKQIGDTVNLLTKSISTCCEVVSRGGTGRENRQQQSQSKHNLENPVVAPATTHANNVESSAKNMTKNTTTPVAGPASVKNRSPGLGPQQTKLPPAIVAINNNSNNNSKPSAVSSGSGVRSSSSGSNNVVG